MFFWVALSLSGGTRDYGLAGARLTGAPYGHKHSDYDRAAGYVKSHEQPGDLFITLAPPDIPAYYLGRDPDYIIQTGRNKLLYLVERKGKAVDTILGQEAILTRQDLEHVMENHHRIWLITDQGSYLHSVPRPLSDLVLDDFDAVMEGERTSVFLWRG